MDPAGRIAAWCLENAPSGRALLFGGPPALAGTWGALALAARLRRRGVRVGSTRKVFHVLVFATVAALQALSGPPAVCLFGAAVSLVVLRAVLRGPGHPHDEALARPADAPHRTLFVLVPWFATLAGGLAANLLFGPIALVGYLVAVLLASLLGVAVAVALTPALRTGATTAPAVLAIALAAAAAEAASPHGLDNLTMQVVPTARTALLLT